MAGPGDDDPALSPTADDSMRDALAATSDASDPRAVGVAVAPGTVIDGQFRIERLLGQGGMGAVYLARELRLDRDVAIKLGKVVSTGALRRVEREAVALAQLQHPNVVVVHQVGKHAGRLYLAMEYVPGNAREWLAAAPRTWREIALLYAAAGDGLAAAHAAGFVHRDFKPDNVLVGSDGRPRVADFGLVRATTDSLEESLTQSAPALATMTQTGSVLGTPAYMAPEQFAGAATDARTDQFALCASVWEALFGTRPFAGATPAEIVHSIEHERVELPEANRRVPRRLITALRRGLASERADRWPSLAPLLVELRRDPSLRQRRIALAAGVAALLGVAIAVPLAVKTGHDPCSDGTAEIAKVWNPARATLLSAAFQRANLTTSWESLRPAVDHYAHAWAAAHRAACRATRVDGSQSEAMLDQRMLCLSRARANLDTMLATAAESRFAEAAVAQSLDRLYELDRCSDTTTMAQQVPLPADPAVRAKIEAAAKLVDDENLQGLESFVKDNRVGPDAALAAARDTAWPPLIAQAMAMHAGFASDPTAATKEYRDAIVAAFAAGDDRTAAWAFADGAWQLTRVSKLPECETWIELARGLWTRLGKPDDLGNRIEGADSERLVAVGDAAAALAAVRRANEMSERAYPANEVDRAWGHFNLARALEVAGRDEDAARELDTAIALATKVRGDHHPMLATELQLGAQLAQRLGKVDTALAYARRALAIDEAWYDAHDPRLATALNSLGQMLALTGDVANARPYLERALALDPEDRRTSVHLSLAMLEAQSGNYARAIELGTVALAQPDRDSGADIPLEIALGIAHRELHHLDDSYKYLARARAQNIATLGADAGPTVNAEIELSYTLVAMQRAPEAVQLLAPALALAGLPPPVAAELHTAYGKALGATGDRANARREVATGRDAYRALGDAFSTERDQADAWLRQHP